MKNTFKIVFSFFVILLVASCSTKKDTFVNRSFHAVNAKYNVLYNGNEAFKIGLKQLNENYKDNFWERLPIEPLKVDVLALPGIREVKDNSPQEFEKAEEKAVKAVQKHSMLIARQERNKQIDDAYLLLGKSRYYSKRFVPALEAFNYIIINYPRANLINQTKIWQAKTHIRLRNEEQAIEGLKLLLKDKNLEDVIKEQAHTAMAMAYSKIDSMHKVVDHLKKSIATNYNKEQTTRNLFILGQIYREQKVIDTSTIYFQKVIDFKKAPSKYKIHAYIEKAKNVSTKEDAEFSIEELTKLVKNRDNRPYLDELYYQLGSIEAKNNTKNALEYFKKSLNTSKVNNFQKQLSYEAVGNLYFDKAEFVIAASYYDSIIQIAEDDNTKRVRRLKRKRNNLNEVILYEGISKTNDSIINLVAMSKEERLAFFTSHIEKLKAQEEKVQKRMNTGSGIVSSNTNSKNERNGTWYFYNSQTVGFGEQEFNRIWGNRPLEDNWRLSDKTALNFERNKTVSNDGVQLDNSKQYELSYYLEKIPSDISKIDSIKSERNNAYYKLGLIYKEQFKETNLAIDKLEKLLTFNPESTILLPAKFHLYKIYSEQNNEKSNELKNEIVANYADSKYAKIILNPNQQLSEDTSNSPESEYATVFYEYKDEKLESVIEKATLAIGKYEGLPIVAKFELLKAYATGKKDGIEAFKQALDFVAMNYPNTEEGKKALEVIATIKTKL